MTELTCLILHHSRGADDDADDYGGYHLRSEEGQLSQMSRNMQLILSNLCAFRVRNDLASLFAKQ